MSVAKSKKTAKTRRSTTGPKFQKLLQAERQVLQARLEAARSVLSTHSGELGASLEHTATAFLRDFLPAEYGLGRGFVAWQPVVEDGKPRASSTVHTEAIRTSPQLDIIIYDAVRGGPLANMGTSQVYPIEHVYGYVEVKASFFSDLTHTLEVSRELRAPREGRFIARPMDIRRALSPINQKVFDGVVRTVDQRETNQAWGIEVRRPRLSCWMLAYEWGRRGSLETLRTNFERTWRSVGDYAHIGGALIVGGGSDHEGAYLRCIPDDSPSHSFRSEVHGTRAIGTFKTQMLSDLALHERPPEGATLDYRRYLAAE